MIVNKITLDGFRSHQSGVFAFGPGVNIVCGPNGRGKTNLLEGVFLLAGVKSWRTPLRKELIGWPSPAAKIHAQLESRGRDFEVKLDLPRQGKATATINGVKAGRQSPLSDVFRAVLFSPEDLFLIKGSPSGRRDFMDSALMQLRPRYAQLIQRYTRLLAGKSRILKDESGASLDVLPEYNAQLAAFGADIIDYRARFAIQINHQAAKVHGAISGGAESLEISYKTVSTVEDPLAGRRQVEEWLAQHLAARLEAERHSGTCLSGVHRDDLEITLDGRPARAFASQGQARSGALALRFAQREIFYEDMGEYPVLLMDDVLSELDDRRRDFVCRHTLGGQSIITCCQREPGFEEAAVIEL